MAPGDVFSLNLLDKEEWELQIYLQYILHANICICAYRQRVCGSSFCGVKYSITTAVSPFLILLLLVLACSDKWIFVFLLCHTQCDLFLQEYSVYKESIVLSKALIFPEFSSSTGRVGSAPANGSGGCRWVGACQRSHASNPQWGAVCLFHQGMGWCLAEAGDLPLHSVVHGLPESCSLHLKTGR